MHIHSSPLKVEITNKCKKSGLKVLPTRPVNIKFTFVNSLKLCFSLYEQNKKVVRIFWRRLVAWLSVAKQEAEGESVMH
jgi:hypothetical protein